MRTHSFLNAEGYTIPAAAQNTGRLRIQCKSAHHLQCNNHAFEERGF